MPVSRKIRPVLVGESNPYGADPYFALYPAPDGCSGHRLCCLILGMQRSTYLDVFDRTDLCAGTWSMREARQRAVTLIRSQISGDKLVLLGAKVCQAFGVAYEIRPACAGCGTHPGPSSGHARRSPRNSATHYRSGQ